MEENQFELSLDQLYEKATQRGKVAQNVSKEAMTHFYSIVRSHYNAFTNANGDKIEAGFSYDIISEKGALRVSTTETDYFRALKLFNSPNPTTEYGKYLILVVRDGKRENNGKTEEWTTFKFSCVYNPIEEQAE